MLVSVESDSSDDEFFPFFVCLLCLLLLCFLFLDLPLAAFAAVTTAAPAASAISGVRRSDFCQPLLAACDGCGFVLHSRNCRVTSGGIERVPANSF